MQTVWNTVNNPDGTLLSKPETIAYALEEDADAAAGFIATAKTIATNEEVQALGKAVLNGIPALMRALKAVSQVHPFVALAFLPFQFAYEQGIKHHDNEKIRLSLFESIKEVMLTVEEMNGLGITKDDTRTTTTGELVPSRLNELGRRMEKDILECYNALDAMKKQSLIGKFCKAHTWNERLATWKYEFKQLKKDLHLALTFNTALVIHDMSDRITEIHRFVMEFEKYKTAQEHKIEAFFKAHGDANQKTYEEIIYDDSKCAELIKLQNDQTVTHNISSTYATAGARRSGQESGKADSREKTEPREKEAIAKLRKEYRTDVEAVITENMESFSKRLELSLQRLRQDLKSDIHEEVDRVIKFGKRGPHMRLTDSIMRQVWKDQGWRGSAKTRTLVLALRDYLVERAEQAVGEFRAPSPTSPSGTDDDEDQDPETAMGNPLPDSWMLDYLRVKRLRNLQQVLDPDTSGFSTIAEVNAFTRSRYGGWTLPRWISYWAIGWQIYATRYCTEIDEIFNQMFLIREKVGLQMPGNKTYLNNYLSETWPHVVSLTSAIERFQGSEWLAAQFKEYIDTQENAFRAGLNSIKYDIDSTETVHEIISGEPIERWIFMLLAIILRRHLAKMHLCLSSEMNAEELADDSSTVQFVAEAAWLRYNDLLEFYKHQQIIDMKQNFDWFSCGLFRNYFEWKEWMSYDYLQKNEIISYSAVSTISEMKPEDMVNILVHAKARQEVDMILEPNPETKLAAASTLAEEVDQTIENINIQEIPSSGSNEVVNTEVVTDTIPSGAPEVGISKILDSLSGVWFGFHITEEGPYTGMIYLKITAAISEEKMIVIQGEGSSFTTADTGKLTGSVTTIPTSDGRFKAELRHELDTEDYTYHALLNSELQILSGTCESAYWGGLPGTFLLKKTPSDDIMCHRPLVLRSLTSKELWLFAYNAIVDGLRRRKPAMVYFLGRMKMFKRCLELFRDSTDQSAELSRLQASFTVSEYAEILKLSGWYNRASDLHEALNCDICSETILRSRVLCLDCESKRGAALGSVEFDAKEECITSSTLIGRDDLITPHLPTHLLLKTRDRLLLTDYPSVKRRAGICAALAGRLYKPDTNPVPAPRAESVPQGQTISGIIAAGSTEGNIVETTPHETSPTFANPDGSADKSNLIGVSHDGPENVSGGATISQENPILDESVVEETTSQVPSTSNTSDPHQPGEEAKPAEFNFSDSAAEEEVVMLNCLICKERVSTPCWYCIDCEQNDAFVCAACEIAVERLLPWEYLRRYRDEVRYHLEIRAAGKPQPLATSDPRRHNVLHLLIRFGNGDGKASVDVPATEGSDQNLQAPRDLQLHEVERRLFERMDEDKRQREHLQEQVGAVEQRLMRIEALLAALLPNKNQSQSNM
ncbi:hypothetical protein C8R45DRAFT_961144 [Mycena sanguinolenta]|nr:hypothetical protein C8R45DRAFT_961144 [Mycena sanguinolenta]